MALVGVETRGFGFLADRRPQILFERHTFHELTHGRFSASHPDISNPISGGYKGGTAEYDRLEGAMMLNRQAALESASWGLGQTMGCNARYIGYGNVDAIIEAFKNSENAQLQGVVDFITKRNALLQAYHERNWATVAFFYNGKGFAARGTTRGWRAHTTISPRDRRPIYRCALRRRD